MSRGILEVHFRSIAPGATSSEFGRVMGALACLGRPMGALACLLLCASPALAQPSTEVKGALREEYKARREGKPFAQPTDPQLVGKVVRGTIKTPDSTEFRFTNAPGTMLYVTNTATGEKFSIVISPLLKTNSAGEPVIIPPNADDSSDVTVHSFRIEGEALVETQFSAITTKNSEAFVDDKLGGSGAVLFVKGVFETRPSTSLVGSNAICCVNCGTYQICGSSVSSSCGSCSAGGTEPQNKDGLQ